MLKDGETRPVRVQFEHRAVARTAAHRAGPEKHLAAQCQI